MLRAFIQFYYSLTVELTSVDYMVNLCKSFKKRLFNKIKCFLVTKYDNNNYYYYYLFLILSDQLYSKQHTSDQFINLLNDTHLVVCG